MIKNMMCFIINYPIICHSQHLRTQKSNMATMRISWLCHINVPNTGAYYIIFYIFTVKDFIFWQKCIAFREEIILHQQMVITAKDKHD